MIFIDTGAFIARFVHRDQYYHQAVDIWQRIQKKKVNCFTSNFVLDETFTLLARRVGYRFAIERARNIYASKYLNILRPTQDDEIEALDLFEKYADQKISYTDCISFVLMKNKGIVKAFTFDLHFEIVGFELF